MGDTSIQYFTKLYSFELLQSVEPEEATIFRGLQRRVSEEQNHSLMEAISLDEVRCDVFELGANKCLGLDGFPDYFYQSYSDLVEGDLVKLVQAFME